MTPADLPDTLPPHASRGSMNLDAAVRLMSVWGRQLETAGEWRYVKALLLVAAVESWDAAAQIADALGVHPEDQQRIYQQAQREKTP